MKSLALFFAALFFISCNGDPEKSQTSDEQKTGVPTGPEVIIETSMGTIRARLHEDTAPITVQNYLSYVDKGFYDNTIFHRVMSNFMIQGGGFEMQNGVAREKTSGKGIKNESPNSKSNVRGTLAMARTGDPDSATAQFFINVSNNDGTGPVTNLNYPHSNGHGYAVFGEVIEGMDVVDKIKEVSVSTIFMNSQGLLGRVSTGSHENVPVDPVLIQSIRRAD